MKGEKWLAQNPSQPLPYLLSVFEQVLTNYSPLSYLWEWWQHMTPAMTVGMDEGVSQSLTVKLPFGI